MRERARCGNMLSPFLLAVHNQLATPAARQATLSLRLLSTGPSKLVDDIIQYVRTGSKGNAEQAGDVLRSGMSQVHGDPLQQARLSYVLSEVNFDSGKWEEGLTACRDALAKLRDSTSAQADTSAHEALQLKEAELEAGSAATRALLVLGRDGEASDAAAAVAELARGLAGGGPVHEAARWRYLVNSTALQGLVQHARDQFSAALDTFSAVQALVDHVDQRHGAPTNRDAHISFALLAAANFKQAVGDMESAASLAERAAAGAAESIKACEGSVDVAKSPLLAAECRAGALLCAAQLRMKRGEWEAAEDGLSTALEAAEAVSGERHPRVVLPLLLTGEVFSRTRRVTYAEGLYRECAKLMALESTWPPSHRRPVGEGGTSAPASLRGLNASVAALLSWRAAQLMAALPNRSTELMEWERSATLLFGVAQPNANVADELGSRDALRGKGSWGNGCTLDLWSRRALPCD